MPSTFIPDLPASFIPDVQEGGQETIASSPNSFIPDSITPTSHQTMGTIVDAQGKVLGQQPAPTATIGPAPAPTLYQRLEQAAPSIFQLAGNQMNPQQSVGLLPRVAEAAGSPPPAIQDYQPESFGGGIAKTIGQQLNPVNIATLGALPTLFHAIKDGGTLAKIIAAPLIAHWTKQGIEGMGTAAGTLSVPQTPPQEKGQAAVEGGLSALMAASPFGVGGETKPEAVKSEYRNTSFSPYESAEARRAIKLKEQEALKQFALADPEQLKALQETMQRNTVPAPAPEQPGFFDKGKPFSPATSQSSAPVVKAITPTPAGEIPAVDKPLVTPENPVSVSATATASNPVPIPRELTLEEHTNLRHDLASVMPENWEEAGLLTPKQAAGFVATRNKIWMDALASGDYISATEKANQVKADIRRAVGQNTPGTPEDLAAYKVAQDNMAAALKSGDETALQAAWKENEAIKNKYGGMPPKGQVTESVESVEPVKPVEPVAPAPDQSQVNSDIAGLLNKPKGILPKVNPDAGHGGFTGLTPKNFFETLGFNKGTKLDVQQLVNRVKNKLGESSAAVDILNGMGLSGWMKQNPRASVDDLQKWVKENEPRVETHVYGMEGKVSEAKKEYDRMTHEWYETLDAKTRRDIDIVKSSSNPRVIEILPETLRKKGQQYKELYQQTKNEPRNKFPRATDYYNQVSPLPTNEPMPEWTTTKSGKNVQRVDVVIPHKYVIDPKTGKKLTLTPSVLWQPDNLHENLPNTLGWAMIQYKTGPKGEKIAVIAEAQSRWGQDLRNDEKYAKEQDKTLEQYQKDTGLSINKGHPLLRDYNRLILKAAIEQARKEGATHIVVPDAETAMMTEGHDQHTVIQSKVASDKATLDELAQDKGYTVTKGPYEKSNGLWEIQYTERPTQEPGMRLNYDTILPKILEELTGSKGERVSLGEHKNAYQYRQAEDTAGEMTPARNRILEDDVKERRSNLIFRNSDGTPKTDVSGLMFDIKNVEHPEDYTLTGKDTPTSMKAASASPVQSLNKTSSDIASFRASEQGAINGKIIQELTDKLRNHFSSNRTSDLFRDVFNHENFHAAVMGFAGKDVPHTLQRSEPVADALVKAASADATSRLMAKSMVTDVLGDQSGNEQFRKQLGAAIYEDMRKAYQAANPQAQTTPVLDVRSTPFSDQQQLKNFMSRPDVQEAIQRHKDTVQKLAQEQHEKLGGKLAATGKDTGAFLNLKALLDEQQTENQGGSGRGPLNTLKKKSAFGQQRAFSGQDYEFDYRTLGERMIRRNYAEAAKQDFYTAIDKAGVGKILKPGDQLPEDMVSIPIQRRSLVVLKHGEPPTWVNQNEQLAVPRGIAAEVRQAFQTDSPVQNSSLKLFNHLVTGIQVQLGVDAAAHTMNDIAGVTTAIRSRVGKNIFPLGAVDTIHRLWRNGARVISDSPEIQREVADMAKQGVTFRLRSGGGWSPRFLRFVDTVSRVTLNEIFNEGVKDGSFKDSALNRRTFINSQLGQYNPRLMTRIEQAFQESAVGPFIVAGKNFNKLAARQIGLGTGVEATSTAMQAKLKAFKAAGLISAGIAAPLLLNKYFTGKYLGTTGTKAGEIDLGKRDKEGNEIRLDMFKLLMLRRGMRVTGTEGAIEGQLMPRLRGEQPEPISQTLKQGAKNIGRGIAMPYIGPAPNIVATLATGKSVLQYDQREPGDQFPYVKAATKSLNPMLGAGVQGHNKGSASYEIGKRFGGMLGLTFRSEGATIRNLARTFTIKSGKGEGESYPPSPYMPLVNALRDEDNALAMKQYKKLLQTKSDAEVQNYFHRYPTRPMTWSQEGDGDFLKTLSPEQRKLYESVREDDKRVAERFYEIFVGKPYHMPKKTAASNKDR